MSSSPPNRFLAKKFSSLQDNPWVAVSAYASKLAAEPGGVCNLGQGFSDMMAPNVIRDAMKAVMSSEDASLHQYARSYGHPRLTRALSRWYEGSLGRPIHSADDVLVTVGADEALACSILGMVDSGDEVIIIEPSYDIYEGMVTVAGGVPVCISLRPPTSKDADSAKDWTLDPSDLRAAFSAKTKLIVVNSPQNPIGKVYSEKELELIASLCAEFDVVAINDGVYENLVYEDQTGAALANLDAASPPRLAARPGMADRTVTIGSAGKSFNATGWKLGWAIGDPALIHCLRCVHASLIFAVPTPIQECIAVAFETALNQAAGDTFFATLRRDLRNKRDEVTAAFAEAGLRPLRPQGGYFVTVDVSAVDVDAVVGGGPDGRGPAERLIEWLMREKRLVVMPTFPFFTGSRRRHGDHLIRVCFNKERATIDRAISIVRSWGAEMKAKNQIRLS